MSVPKRFKTKRQLISKNITRAVFVKTNTIHRLDPKMLFVDHIKKKPSNKHIITFFYKKRSSIVAIP